MTSSTCTVAVNKKFPYRFCSTTVVRKNGRNTDGSQTVHVRVLKNVIITVSSGMTYMYINICNTPFMCDNCIVISNYKELASTCTLGIAIISVLEPHKNI